MTFATIAQYCSFVTSIITLVILLVKPIRNKFFGYTDFREGQKCLLRSNMLAIYYKGKENNNTLRQYDFENFVFLYAAYKAAGGNSFIDKISNEVNDMEVVS